MKDRFLEGLKKYLSIEIAVEYKACLYFFAILFFHCCYLMIKHVYSASILCMFEMIMTAYFMCYLQIYVFDNFDEAEKLRKKEVLGIFTCSILYTALSYVFGWFDRQKIPTLLFFAFILLGYGCMYLVNKIKRRIDTENLNKMLWDYKKTN